MRRQVGYLSVLALLVLGCSRTGQEEAIADAFRRWQAALSAGNNVALLEQFSSESQAYFALLGQLAVGSNESEKEAFCQMGQIPWSTRYLLQACEFMASVDEATEFTALNVIVTAQALQFGILDEAKLPDYRFDSVADIQGSRAVAIINYRLAPETWVQSRFTFLREDGQWRLDYASTLTLMERYLATNAQKSGLPARQFIQQLLMEGDADGQRLYYDPNQAERR